jgi:hypothetical protein
MQSYLRVGFQSENLWAIAVGGYAGFWDILIGLLFSQIMDQHPGIA